ncbi:hypothetical protein BS47DRAFT_1482567 [Hydnum rufescens UP504]|uniref:Uncharacterized protein n=1 Tax=Hydnum rufescens UP504 TaxID=1448309 RepID=A0A9P6E1H4_9AGAM|nr:hypothetical protein BS47DRAFT_1482567 [Hydnum rufescens UP504]
MNQREKDVWSRGIDETYPSTVLHPHRVRCPGMSPVEECTLRQPSCLGPAVDGTPGLVGRNSNHSCRDAHETVEPLADRFSLHTHPDPSSSSRSGAVDGRILNVSLLFTCYTSVVEGATKQRRIQAHRPENLTHYIEGLDFEWELIEFVNLAMKGGRSRPSAKGGPKKCLRSQGDRFLWDPLAAEFPGENGILLHEVVEDRRVATRGGAAVWVCWFDDADSGSGSKIHSKDLVSTAHSYTEKRTFAWSRNSELAPDGISVDQIISWISRRSDLCGDWGGTERSVPNSAHAIEMHIRRASMSLSDVKNSSPLKLQPTRVRARARFSRKSDCGCLISNEVVSNNPLPEALAAYILTKLRGELNISAIKAPGGTVFSDNLDITLDKATHDLLRPTGSIAITKEDTIFLNGDGGEDAIAARCEQIRSLLNDPTTSGFDKTKLQERLAKLSGGVAVIKVGGSSEVEIGEKDGYDDALNATRVAVEEGIVPCGGVVLLKRYHAAEDDIVNMFEAGIIDPLKVVAMVSQMLAVWPVS